jgi:Tfp pilus assembly protein PilO
MNIVAFYRGRIVLAVLALVGIGFGYWYMQRYSPRLEQVTQVEQQLETQLQINRAARQQEIALGIDGIEDAIRNLRLESNLLTSRVPSVANVAESNSDMTLALTGAANRFGVRVHGYEPVASSIEGRFQSDGFRVQVVGRYHDVGAFLTEMLSLDRLTQIRSFAMDVVPDSLMRASERGSRTSRDQVGAVAVAPSRSGVNIPTGEVPFNVVSVFTLHWFSLRDTAQDVAPEEESSARTTRAARNRRSE